MKQWWKQILMGCMVFFLVLPVVPSRGQAAEVPEELAPDGTVLIPARVEHRQRLNPDYDGTQPYIPRTQRPEWDAVGLLGKLVAVDDGSCQVNGWAAVGENGIAAYSAQQTKYRVVARLDETHIRILIL